MSSSGSFPLDFRAVIVVEAYSTRRYRLASLGLPRLGIVPSSLLPLGLLTDRPRVKVACQRVQRVGPHRLVLRDPLVQVGETLRVDRVDALLGPDRDLDELRLSEDPQVPRYAGLREARELGGDAPCIAGTPREQVEDGSTCGVCDRREDIGRHHRNPAGWPWVFTPSAGAGGLTRAASGGCRQGP